MVRVEWFAVVFALVLLGAATTPAGEAENCFAPWLNDEPPKIVETLEKTIIDGEVEFTRLKFLSRVDGKTGEKVLIYACLARPTTPGKKPAVLVCHGGGGYADLVSGAVIGWAKRGYVSVCQDQPGIGNPSRFHSEGPCVRLGLSAATIFPAKMTSPEDSPLFDGVVAALNGLRLLRSQPDVDKSRVGIFGGSWGGYMTTMIASLAGNRARASFSVYGCGYFDVGSAWTHRLKGLPPRARAIWLKHLDAGRRAKNLTAAHFVASPTNDWFFWPNAVMRTLADVPGEKNWCFMPNESHMLSLPGGMAGPPPVNHRENRTYMETVWMAHHLKGEGAPFHRVTATGQPVRHGREVEVRFRVHGAVGKTQAYVWWAAGELPWRTKWWEATPTKPLGDGRFVSRFPIDEPSEPVNWFAAVTDSRNVTCSTLIQTFEPTAVGFGNDDGSPPVFRQDFEQPGQHRRWRMKYAARRPGRHRVSSQAAHSGKHSLEIVPGQSAIICFGIRAATLRRGRATRLTLWVKAAKKPCPLPTVQLVAEQPDGDRLQWEWRPKRIPEAETQWTQVAMPLSEFRFVGGKPPIPLLSPSLGLLQLTTKPDVHVFVDDVEAQ